MESGTGLFGSLYPPGEVIFREGEEGDTMYVIQSGAVKVSHFQGEKETLLAVREKGDFFGEMALFGNEMRSATITTLRETRLLAITRASLLEKVQRDPKVALHLLKGLILRIQEADEKIKKGLEESPFLRAALGSVPTAAAAAPASTPQPPLAESPSAGDLADIWKVEESSLSFPAGEAIFQEGQPGEAMFIILDGAVELTQGAGEDKQVLRRLGAGDFFGEWALITDNPRFATATAAAPTRLMPVERARFTEQIKTRPELAAYILQGLAARLRALSAILANPRASIAEVRKNWQPLIRKQARVKIAIVSLATCAGCSAVLLDDRVLAQVMEAAEINYCPMLIDQERIQEADLALVDGAVRLKDDLEKLEEARAKSRFLAAWGTCAAFGGIPAEANRFEVEDLIAETFGATGDIFSYYLSGERGVESDRRAYQEKGIAMLRKAGKLDDFVRVDYYVPGCPPSPAMLLQLVGELTGQGSGKPQPVVCSQCDRKPTRSMPESLKAFPQGNEDRTACFNSLGVFCMGFITQGGCEASCTQRGLPCWACRGPAKIALKRMAEGDSFEEAVVQAIARRCKLEEAPARALVKQLRRQGNALFQFEPEMITSLTRIR